MVEIDVKGTEKSFYMNKELKHNFDVGVNQIKNFNQDMVILIVGPEGAGKSQGGRQFGYYLAEKLGSGFDIDGASNVYHDIEPYIHDSRTGDKYRVQILDESRQALYKLRSTASAAVAFTNYMSYCRFKNGVHIIILPAYHDLDPYIALWRADFVIYMEKNYKTTGPNPEDVELDLGTFRLYSNGKNLRYCYNNKYIYPKQYDVRDSLSNVEVLSKAGLKAYDQSKEKQLKKYDAQEYKKNRHKMQKRFVELLNFTRKNSDKTMQEIASELGCSRRTLYNYIEQVEYREERG